MPDVPERPCANPRCTCPAGAESDFCSARCARASLGRSAPAACDCGHSTCQGGGRPAATDPAPRQ